MLIVEAGEGAGIHLASFDLDALRAYRRAETMGNALRRPAAYRSLTDTHIADIFVRLVRYGRPPGV
jgi:N-carbamoylputrescine amidase